MSVEPLDLYRRASELRLVAALIAIVVSASAGEAVAQPIQFQAWSTPSGGSYTVGGNWSPMVGVPEGPLAGAAFALDATYTVGFSRNIMAGAAVVTDGTVTWDLDNGVLSQFYTVGSLTVDGIPTLLAVRNGLVVAQTVQVLGGGRVDTATSTLNFDGGTATVTGDGSTWISGFLDVGSSGTGTLTIADGGRVEDDSGSIGGLFTSNGTVTVSGANSIWTNDDELRVGSSGTGALTIADGGRVEDARGSIGTFSDSDGTVIVTGAGSTWSNDDELRVGNQGAGTLTIEAGGAVSSLFGIIGSESGANGTVTVDGAGSDWTSSGILQVGDFGEGTLNITSGGTVSNGLNFATMIGVSSGSTGTVSVAGSGSTLTSSGELRLGIFGTAMLTIEDGGSVSNTNRSFIAGGLGSTGAVTVSGANSIWANDDELNVGSSGTGALTIADGGRVEDARGSIGTFSDSDGTVIVTGAGSTWSNDDELRVGNQGAGTLTIEAGGAVSSLFGIIGSESGANGTVAVDGAGSTWTNTLSLLVGGGGSGRLNITSGGTVSNGLNFATMIGVSSGSSGTVSVAGSGSTLTSSGELRVGNFGMAMLTIEDGGSVSNTDLGLIAVGFGSTGAVTVTGTDSTWTMAGGLGIGGNPSTGTNGGTGTLNITLGGTVSVAQDTVLFPDGLVRLQGGTLATTTIDFQGGGELQWTSGTLSVDVYNGNLTNPNGGTLAPGRSAGGTTILGDYTQQAGATLQIEIGGTATATQFDFVNVTGTALLGGMLELALINNFVPGPADQFIMFNAADLLGFFGNAGNNQRLDTIDGRGSFLVHYGPTSAFDPNQIVLTAFELAAGLPGDYNDDGIVDAADYVVWRDNLDSATSLANDDTPGVGPDDYDRWKLHFGEVNGANGSGSVSALPSAEPLSAAVPEPSTLVLLMFAAAGWCLRRDRVA